MSEPPAAPNTSAIAPHHASLDFTGKLVVITGVGRAGQVGEALALRFAQLGATLALVDLGPDDVNARAAELNAQGFKASAFAGNLSDVATAQRICNDILGHPHHQDLNGAVHAVICAAGGFGASGPVDETDAAAWHKQFTINLDTAFGTTRAFLPALRKGAGALVYFGSAAVLPGGNPSGMAAYAAAKSGVLTLMLAVARDERQHGVRANAVAPTQVRTAQNVDNMGANKDYVERESVADVVTFLASPLARNVSGQVLKLA